MTTEQAVKTTCERASHLDQTPRPFKRLMVAVDGSEESHLAADLAARLAAQLKADVVLINVFSLADFGVAGVAFVVSDVRRTSIEAADSLLTWIKNKMPAQSHIETVLREGDPATEILNAAVVYDADLIIMGTHARGRLGKAVLGSVARAVAQKATCPVLTVAHPPAAETPDSITARETKTVS